MRRGGPLSPALGEKGKPSPGLRTNGKRQSPDLACQFFPGLSFDMMAAVCGGAT